MRSITRLPRFAAASFAAGCLSPFAAAQISIAPAVERASRALAHVSVLFETRKGTLVRVERSSSGFVVDPRGLLLTDEHLVDEIPTGGGKPGAEYWLQVIIGGDRPCGATVVARDERLDLALLQLELEPGELIPALELESGPGPELGVEAFALGRPRGGQYFALAGVVSQPSGPTTLRKALLEPGELLLTDAPPLDEIDGGPFVDRLGLALGIMNAGQHTAYDAKSDENKARNPVDYAVAVRAAAIRRAFPDQLGKSSTSKASYKEPEAGPGSQDGAAPIVRTCARAVVSVWAGPDDTRPKESAPNDPYAKQPAQGLGSGVIVDPTGLVLTSSDFIGAATEVGVKMLDGASYRGRVLRSLPARHVALVQLKLAERERLPAVELGSSDGALGGETIAVIGNPYGNTPTISAGVLSALEVEGRLRIGTWVHDGHKGGALFDAAGHLIGIPAADDLGREEKARGESYLGVAIPIDRVREWFAADLEPYAGTPGLCKPPATDEKEVARRRNTVTKIIAATRDSLLNVEIKAEAEQSSAFDPFATHGELRLLGQGSGVVIDESGLAITNWHVTHPTLGDDGLQRSDRALEVTLPSGRRYTAKVLATSRDDDLALIQLELPEGETVKAVPLGASKPLSRGDVVVAIGNPYGKANTVTVGIVAAKDQDVQIAGRLHAYTNMLQTDAAINPGNSGGALLDIQGRLIGINSAGRSGAGMAIPVERVREVFGQKLLATMGPFLGLTVDDAPGGGVLVNAVDEHSPAAAAGVQAGDVLRALDGRAVASAVEYGNALLARRPAQAIHIDLERQGARVAAELHPVSQAVWRIFRQTGIEVAEVDYAVESARVREASIALHRAYTGLADGEPTRLMSGALRIVQVAPHDSHALDVLPGDLVLGASAVVRTIDAEQASLVRFENVGALKDFLEPLAANEGNVAECWFVRDGQVHTTKVAVFKVH
jgi:S1-C subfamily serine protease